MYGSTVAKRNGIALHSYSFTLGNDELCVPVPASSRLFESSIIAKTGYLEVPLNLEDWVIFHSSVDTYGLESYVRFRKWRAKPPGLFSDIQFLEDCNKATTMIVGQKLAKWLDSEVQIPE